MTGWQLCRYRTTCRICGRWADRVWRFFVTQSISTMCVCESCAEHLTKED